MNLLRGFVDFVADGGDPAAFDQLANGAARAGIIDVWLYALLNKNLAEGADANHEPSGDSVWFGCV